MLTIKLKRIGKKHQPSYRIIVQEKRSKLGGRYVEDLGWYNPILNKSQVSKERIQYWMNQGAKPTATVHNFLVKNTIIKGSKIAVHKKAKKNKEESVSKDEDKKVMPGAGMPADIST